MVAMSSYADYCPIAVGVDVLGDRWTPLVIRELMVGATGFNDIHRGVPRMSRTLLSQRLRMLERRGVVTREAGERGRPGRYELTAAGQALTPIVWAMGHWAAEWVFGDPADEECDGVALLWRLHQFAVPAALPERRTLVHLVLTGPGATEGWLSVDDRRMTVCLDEPGRDVDLSIEAVTGHLQRWLNGRADFRRLVADGQVRLVGPARLVRAFPGWFDVSRWVDDARRARQREARTA